MLNQHMPCLLRKYIELTPILIVFLCGGPMSLLQITLYKQHSKLTFFFFVYMIN